MTITPRICLLLTALSLFSCQPSPQKSFDVAVLNSNASIGFANDGLWRELQSPSVKMGKTKDELLPMKRSEVIDSKIKFTEDELNELNGIRQTDDNRDIVQASLALHNFMLPVYKTEYMQLAKAFDSGAPATETEKLDKAIREKYSAQFEGLYNRLIGSGKAYATKHGIDVRWSN